MSTLIKRFNYAIRSKEIKSNYWFVIFLILDKLQILFNIGTLDEHFVKEVHLTINIECSKAILVFGQRYLGIKIFWDGLQRNENCNIRYSLLLHGADCSDGLPVCEKKELVVSPDGGSLSSFHWLFAQFFSSVCDPLTASCRIWLDQSGSKPLKLVRMPHRCPDG